MTNLQYVSQGPASKARPKQLVVLVHGLSGTGQDIIVLAPVWAPALPEAVFVAPDAPELNDMSPVGRQWFSLGVIDPHKLGAGVRQGQRALDGFIDAMLAKYELPPDAYALMGFSQGAMTVLFTGLRRAVPPKAILAYSGALIDPDSLAAEMRHKVPVLLVHGELDDVVPTFRSREAEAALRRAGVPVQALYEPQLTHWLGEPGIQAGAAFLRRHFAA